MEVHFVSAAVGGAACAEGVFFVREGDWGGGGGLVMVMVAVAGVLAGLVGSCTLLPTWIWLLLSLSTIPSRP